MAREVWYFAQRMDIDPSCLDCHGTIDDVKKPEFIAEYGDMLSAYGGEAKIGGFLDGGRPRGPNCLRPEG